MHVILSLSRLQRAGEEILKLTLRRGKAVGRGISEVGHGRRQAIISNSRDTKRDKQCLGLRWWYYVPFNFHTLSYCNQRGVSCLFFVFLRSSSFLACDGPLASTRRTRRGTRPPATSLPDDPHSSRPDALVCTFCVGFWTTANLPKLSLSERTHFKHCPFFLPASVGVYSSGSSAGATQWGIQRDVRPVTGWPPSSSDVHHHLMIVRRTRVRSPQLRRHR